MSGGDFIRSVDIAAPLPLVWSVMADVEHWPEWTASVSRVQRLTPGPLQVGSRVRIHQPKLPPALWRVTELVPDRGFTWIGRAPGVRVTARHMVEGIAMGTRATLSIVYQGVFGTLLARWVGDLNGRYLDLEANGLKSRCLELAAHPTHEHEIH
ncbi:MAG TPA: SRPBCC family protein [Candidatus Dormibacteraeota bacterium]|nr:SRPBCC family protein [Candidatus Dormibacteraeota bacterium]